MYASLTTPRETPRSSARVRDAGRRSPSGSRAGADQRAQLVLQLALQRARAAPGRERADDPLRGGRADPRRAAEGRARAADAPGARAARARRPGRNSQLQPGGARRGRVHGRDQHRRDHLRLAGHPRPDGDDARSPILAAAGVVVAGAAVVNGADSRLSALGLAIALAALLCEVGFTLLAAPLLPGSARPASPPGRRSSPPSSWRCCPGATSRCPRTARRPRWPTSRSSPPRSPSCSGSAPCRPGAAKAGLLVGLMPVAAVAIDAVSTAARPRPLTWRGRRWWPRVSPSARGEPAHRDPTRPPEPLASLRSESVVQIPNAVQPTLASGPMTHPPPLGIFPLGQSKGREVL